MENIEIVESDSEYGFAQTPNNLLNLKDVSLRAKGLFGYIISKPPKWRFSAKGMATQLKEGIEAVRLALKELEDCHYLTRTKKQDKLGHWTITYKLHMVPELTNPALISSTQNPVHGNPVQGIPQHGNRNDISNNIESNKEEKESNNIGDSDESKKKMPYNLLTGKNGVVFCQVLRDSCREYKELNPNLYSKDLYVDFISYWSEPNGKNIPKWYSALKAKGGTWSLPLRLSNWAKKSQNMIGKKKYQNPNEFERGKFVA